MEPTQPPYLRAVPDGAAAAHSAASADDGDGVTRPTSRGSGRFITDVIVELGFAERERVEAAVQSARAGSQTPEELLVEQSVLSQDQLARAVAERYGLDHLDLTVFNVD